MKAQAFIMDTFTSVPFSGNPTGVICSEDGLKPDVMLSVAREFNYPVTAFIKKRAGADNAYDIRYFTPETEIPACGHATLASAEAVRCLADITGVVFYTASSNVIEATATEGYVMMRYPRCELGDIPGYEKVVRCLNTAGWKYLGYAPQLETLFIEMDDPGLLKAIKPDFDRMREISEEIKEVVVTSVSDVPGYDYLLRSFCPWIGINEDPVTGSVHTVLGGFWKNRLNKSSLRAFQASERGGEIRIEVSGDHIGIGGQTVMVMKGELTIA